MPARIAAALAISLALGCASYWSPSSGYVAVSPEASPEATARSDCMARAEFRAGGGESMTDWNRFEACMGEHGWERR